MSVRHPLQVSLSDMCQNPGGRPLSNAVSACIQIQSAEKESKKTQFCNPIKDYSDHIIVNCARREKAPGNRKRQHTSAYIFAVRVFLVIRRKPEEQPKKRSAFQNGSSVSLGARLFKSGIAPVNTL